jgi:hypothetical protein
MNGTPSNGRRRALGLPDFGRYAGQLRPATHRDAVVVLELERQFQDELDRVAVKMRQAVLDADRLDDDDGGN